MSAATVHDTASTAEVMRFEPSNHQRSRVYDHDKQRRKIFLDLVITFYILSVFQWNKNSWFLTTKTEHDYCALLKEY
jgi:hypothetical protein